MTDFELLLACLLIPMAYVVIYIAGKHDMIALICKMLERRWKKLKEADDYEELERDNPKKVNLYIGNDMSCPSCGKRLRGYEGIRNPYCKFCGQRLER